MKIGEFRKVLEDAEQLYRDSGNVAAVQSLSEISSLFAGREAMTVSAFASLLAKVTAAKDPDN